MIKKFLIRIIFRFYKIESNYKCLLKATVILVQLVKCIFEHFNSVVLTHVLWDLCCSSLLHSMIMFQFYEINALYKFSLSVQHVSIDFCHWIRTPDSSSVFISSHYNARVIIISEIWSTGFESRRVEFKSCQNYF